MLTSSYCLKHCRKLPSFKICMPIMWCSFRDSLPVICNFQAQSEYCVFWLIQFKTDIVPQPLRDPERKKYCHTMDCQSRSESREISPLQGRRGKVCDTGQQNCMASPVKSKDMCLVKFNHHWKFPKQVTMFY